MQNPTRRHFALGFLGTIASVQFLRLAVINDAVAQSVAPLTRRWAEGVIALAADLKTQTLSVTQWQETIEDLNRTISIAALLEYIDFNRYQATLAKQTSGVGYVSLVLPDIDQRGHRFGTHLFVVPPGNAVPPHGHNNLVTAHLVMKGSFRTRTYNRIADLPGRMLLRQTRDEICNVGATTTMSDLRDNIHWFVAGPEPVITLQVGMRAKPQLEYQNPSDRDGRIYVDPRQKPNADGTIEAAVLSGETGHQVFGLG